jgi:hypothetical protein
MLVIYRISNNSHSKPKVPGATKKFCLENALSVFPNAEWFIIADNCDDATIEMCQGLKPTILTKSGNSGSFRKALDIACEYSGIVYLLEDDYLHAKNAETVIAQGLQKADYVTLYNHPDKYENLYDYGEVSKVIRIGQIHWKQTISTTMTFATNAETLREDQSLWMLHREDALPHDHEAFCELQRSLICPIPGLSCHMDLSDSKEEYLPEWVAETLGIPFKELLGDLFPEFTYPETPLRQLKIMQALADMHQ